MVEVAFPNLGQTPHIVQSLVCGTMSVIGELKFNSTNDNEDLTRQKPQEGK